MGLLNIIKESGIDFDSVPLPKKSNVKSNSVELLKKYVRESAVKRLDFYEFTKKYNLKICAILEAYKNNIVVSNCVGFDGITIISTLSTIDFWTGTIPSRNQWYKFSTSDNTIAPFYQFLSFNLKEKIENIYIYYTDSDKILLLCSDTEIDLTDDKYLLDDFTHLVESEDKEIDNTKIEIDVDSTITKYSLEIEKAVKTFLALNLTNLEFLDYFKKIFYNAIFYELNNFLNRHYYIYHTEEVKFNFISLIKTDISDSLFIEHLKKNLAPLLDEEVNLLVLHNLGKASSYSEISSFLKAE